MDRSIAAIFLKALDGLTLRSAATAQNIANANSPAYRQLGVTFEEALREAADGGPVAVRDLQLSTTRAERPGSMRLDLELATASETALRYGALVDLLGRQMQLQRAVIRGGQ